MAKPSAVGRLSDVAEQALRKVEESQGFHDDLVNTVEQRWRQFEGVLDRASEAAQWQSQLHPPYLHHIVESTVAGLLDDRLTYKITPKPRLYNPGEYELAKQGAKAHDILFREQLKADRFNEFQRPYVLDAAVVGVGCAKTFWRNDVAPKKRLVTSFDNGVPKLVETSRVESVFDGPVTEAVDMRDMYWHEAAVSAEKSRWIAQAVWMSYPDLLKLANRGVYDVEAVRGLEKPADPSSSGNSTIEQDREKRGRLKDMIEVLEIWDRETMTVISIGGRKTELRPQQRAWPFWHREYPFTFTSLQPFPRSLRGMSVVQKLAHLQEMTWDLMNQRIDNVRFLNNFIQILRADIDDPDQYPFEPGAQWFMDNPTDVTQWAPNPAVTQISLPAEQMLKTDMQNLAEGQPFTSTSEANQIGANTATEAALVTNLAQMAVKQMKTQVYYAYERIGCQRLYLNQQFIREPIYVDTIGMDSDREIAEILPFLLQGDYRFDITPMAESLNRSEKRAEANSRWQVATATQPVAAASGAPWNLRAFQEDWLEAYDVQDPERYFTSQQPQQQQQQPPGVDPSQTAPPNSGMPPAGVTAPQSIDPAVSPSTQASLSPAVFAQRNLALTGGVANA